MLESVHKLLNNACDYNITGFAKFAGHSDKTGKESACPVKLDSLSDNMSGKLELLDAQKSIT